MSQKPSIPKGTRDFAPMEMARRNYIFDTIREAFKLFGYQQIETPAMENLSTLMGKYGEEGDKLLFKILNSGDFIKGISCEDLSELSLNTLASRLCEKGLRYDLTVPFARFVVQHRNELQTPFKRYQIQPVWRADRPQKGRYREFFQCDADVVGSDSLFNEVELLMLADKVFSDLKVDIVVKLNNRKVLAGIAEVIGTPEMLTDITVAIDKIDKIGLENVEAELCERGLDSNAIGKLRPVLLLTGSTSDKLKTLAELLRDSEEGKKGIEELRFVIDTFERMGHSCEIEFDPSLARGLNYYTGTIIEIKAKNVSIGSISGGGRYDNLTGVFGIEGLSGVGISFGADRIYDVLNQLNLYPEELTDTVKAIVMNFGEAEACYGLRIVKELRENGIAAMLYPEAVKMKKQMAYADGLKIPYVIMAGEDEIKEKMVTLKEMESGKQEKMSVSELIKRLK